MELAGSVSFFSGIWLAQVGDPLAHRQKGVLDRVSCDRLVTRSGCPGLETFGTFVPVAESKDKEVGDLGLLVRDVGEARTDAKG